MKVKASVTPGRTRRLLALVTIITMLVVAAVWFVASSIVGPHGGGSSNTLSAGDPSPNTRNLVTAADTSGKRPVKTHSVVVQPPEPVRSVPSFETAQKLIARLVHIDLSTGKLTREDAKQLNQAFSDLIAQGEVAVPAIRAFLEQNTDLNYSELLGGEAVDHKTLRSGLIDALKQIGGFEALEISLKTLMTTSDPWEIAVLSRDLEQLSPGRYREQSLRAARESLAQALEGKLGDRDLAPLFQVLQSYGDASVIPDLEKAMKQWSYYGALTLASLPDGQGIPSLINQLQEPGAIASGQRDIALQVLAQSSIDYPQASEALLAMARGNQISGEAWSAIALGLAGNNFELGTPLVDKASPTVGGKLPYHVDETGERLFTTPVTGSWLEEQITSRLSLIDQLLGGTTDPSAIQALQAARDSLSSKAVSLAVSPP